MGSSSSIGGGGSAYLFFFALLFHAMEAAVGVDLLDPTAEVSKVLVNGETSAINAPLAEPNPPAMSLKVEERMGEEGLCSKEDILLYQGETAPLPNGIPTYTVQILNTCAGSCAVGVIHVRCGWFSSARLINPRVFRRLSFDDCLVNDGAAIAPGDSVSFQYANSFPYPLSVASGAC
ncbi:TPD1 protein homolog 1-like [Zingiber officinale]|nr:TPD1 protein homolog 1-like [Zingiber officinale]